MQESSSRPRLLGNLLRLPTRALNDRIAADLATAGFADLRPAHFTVFQYLPDEGLRATALAERAQMTKQSMGELIDFLARAGYVERVPDPTDRRARLVRRTARGWAVERAARECIRRVEGEWGQYLGAERMQVFHAILEDLATVLDAPAASRPTPSPAPVEAPAPRPGRPRASPPEGIGA